MKKICKTKTNHGNFSLLDILPPRYENWTQKSNVPLILQPNEPKTSPPFHNKTKKLVMLSPNMLVICVNCYCVYAT